MIFLLEFLNEGGGSLQNEQDNLHPKKSSIIYQLRSTKWLLHNQLLVKKVHHKFH